MKKILLIIVLCFTNLSLISQSRNVPFKNGVFNNNLEFFAMAKVNTKNNSEHSTKAKGHYYLNKNKWSKCYIKTTSNKDYTFDTCNYNIFDKRFEFIIDNNVYFLQKKEVNYIKINNDKFIPSNKITTNNKNYFKEIHVFKNGDKLIEIFFLDKKSIPSNTTLGLYHNKVIINSKKYLLQNNKIIKLPNKKKKILKILNKQNDYKKYKKLNIKKNEDLIEIIR
ncbi:hypothetical protein [Tenacibaculum ovolyticum]|uniref:hypothetical protein n=1 Tax=Tenacibaculum ovolyticum TaxID=104270 RepID=UPI003BA8D896